MNDQTAPQTKPDRSLGDEWEDWGGDLDESPNYDETARLFVVYSSLAVLILFSALGIVLYLIEPRLALIHPMLVFLARGLTAGTVLLTVTAAILIAMSVFTGKNLLFDTRFGQVAASRILPLSLTVARKLGISRDRLGNSFVAFSNAIVRASYRPQGGKTIIIIPRCLSADQKQAIKNLGEQTGIAVFTATGGGQARKVLIQERPAAVIGIACERDLISAIHDVAPKLPTIGVPNKRPEGPCKNTTVDIEQVKQAIHTLTGKAVD
jgi:uncharacterized protein